MKENRISVITPDNLNGHKFKLNRFDDSVNFHITNLMIGNTEATYSCLTAAIEESAAKVEKFLEENGFIKAYKNYCLEPNKEMKFVLENDHTSIWYNKATDILFTVSGEEHSGVDFRGPEKECLDLANLIAKTFTPRILAEEGTVFAVTINGQGRLTISEFGNNGNPCERNNYNPEVIESYDYIISQLNSKEPDGRITILDGRPGTGKTYLIRSMLVDVKGASCIIIPANVVAQAGTPELLTTLIHHKEDYDRKMILIVEDADQVVTKRAGDNMSAVSTLLNLGDGIMGSILDIRVVCTTNATTQDLDEAITRPGRLCKHISVNELSNEQAKKVYARLTNGKTLEKTGKFSLAEVYKMAKDDKFVPKTSKGKVGFGV